MEEPRIPTARNVRYYSEIIAKETGMPHWVVHRILMFAWKHICRKISRKEDVKLPLLGTLYFEKKPRYIKKQNKNADSQEHHTTIGDTHGIAQKVERRADPWDDQPGG